MPKHPHPQVVEQALTGDADLDLRCPHRDEVEQREEQEAEHGDVERVARALADTVLDAEVDEGRAGQAEQGVGGHEHEPETEQAAMRPERNPEEQPRLGLLRLSDGLGRCHRRDVIRGRQQGDASDRLGRDVEARSHARATAGTASGHRRTGAE